MTIPMLPIPNVTPGSVQQAPGFAEQVQPGLSALANLLALRQRKAELDQEQQEHLFRVGQAKQEAQWRDQTGEAIRQSLVGLDTDLVAYLLPNAPDVGGAAPVAVPRLGPVARAVVSAPPGTSFDFARLGSGIIAEGFRRRADAQAQATGVKPDTAYSVDSAGYAIYKTANPVKGTASARHVLKDPNGPDHPSNWVREEIPGQAGGTPPGTAFEDQVVTDPSSPNYGKIVRTRVSPGQVTDPARAFPLSQIKTDNHSAADFLPPMVVAYEQTRNTMPIKPGEEKTLTTFIGALNAGDPEQSAWNILIADKTLSPDTKRWMQGMLSLVAAFVYKASGKAVTKGEFSRFLQFNSPLPYEDEATREAKWSRIEAQMESFEGQARAALALRGIRPPDFKGTRVRLMTDRARQASLRQITDQLRLQHPNWDANRLANEALQQYRRQQPTVVTPEGP